MHLIATIAGVRLQFMGAAVVDPPELAGHYVTEIDGAPVLGAVEGERAYLLVDHRLHELQGSPAYVELWLPLEPCEGGLAAAFVIGDTAGDRRAVGDAPVRTLQALAERLSAATAQGSPLPRPARFPGAGSVRATAGER